MSDDEAWRRRQGWIEAFRQPIEIVMAAVGLGFIALAWFVYDRFLRHVVPAASRWSGVEEAHLRLLLLWLVLVTGMRWLRFYDPVDPRSPRGRAAYALGAMAVTAFLSTSLIPSDLGDLAALLLAFGLARLARWVSGSAPAASPGGVPSVPPADAP